jgi:RHS repeat-associated protein
LKPSYWAALDATSKQRAEELQIKGWGTGTDGPSSKAEICDVYYFHTDQVGLSEELSNDRGNLVWRASYKTWGNTVTEDWSVVSLYGAKVDEDYKGSRPQGDAKQQNLRFQGQYLDRDTGLHYNTFRYYDPDIGRFISPDPIGLAGGTNLGSYSPNPISWIDPWGWTGTYIFTDGSTSYIGKGPETRMNTSMNQRIDGAANATQSTHMDFGNDEMGFIVERKMMEKYNARMSPDFANSEKLNSPGKKLYEAADVKTRQAIDRNAAKLDKELKNSKGY